MRRQHQFPLLLIVLFEQMILVSATSLRAAGAVLQILSRLLLALGA